ncbi:hypothetical protein LZK98_03065 [Sphingomonas cannabina]|uniref:hypothetical protein n=1 Tax=Sphingomonas cannabina TaxID=2899123 RepID=UPI001F42929D|nr:hypothetical protein [Sphingomonas cannabina]UIJ45950.1 hypothetical protein LZK98_03065 [Sphingomonas cannabina]
MPYSLPALSASDTPPVARLARLLVMASGIAFGATLLTALVAPSSWSMWAALSVFMAVTGVQAWLYLHVAVVPVRDGVRSR